MIYLRTWAEINLDAISNNIKQIKKSLNKNTKLMAVVKADAYGHGFFEVSKSILNSGADAFAVATTDEALQLRKSGFDIPLLILGVIFKDDVEKIIQNDIMPVVFGNNFAKFISDTAVKLGKKAKIHIKLDTGMSRLGYVCTQEENIDKICNSILEISKLQNIEIDGIFTHFSKADESDRTYTDLQFKRFMSVVSRLEDMGIKIPTKHVCNSAGIILYPEYQLDMVRCGIITYGLAPSDDVDITRLGLKPAMTLKSVITNLKRVHTDSPVSYGGNYIAIDNTKIATIGIGYADGYSRILSNKAKVLINGEYANIIGNICMDQCMADVTKINNVNIGDEVILFGNDGNNTITVESVAQLMGTINYETICVVGKRVPRVYIQNNRTVNVLNYLV